MAQASAGQAAYAASCAACHRADLGGANEAPQLAGGNFLSQWGSRTSTDLFTYIASTMPPANPASLDEATDLNIVAFGLQANGASAGTQALTVASAIPIGAVAMVQPAAVHAAQQAAQGPGQASVPQGPGGAPVGGRGRGAPPPRRGLTVAGTVKAYTPVTDAMLRDPDPNEWLQIRGNYAAWSYSPLKQMTTANVNDLQHRRAARRAGWRHVGRTADDVSRRRRRLDHRLVRPAVESCLLGRRASETVGAGEPAT